MAISADFFLRYLWWAACYSGWYGLARYSQELKVASFRASAYLWSTVVLEIVICLLISSAFEGGYLEFSRSLREGTNLAFSIIFSLILAIVGTALFVLMISRLQGTIH